MGISLLGLLGSPAAAADLSEAKRLARQGEYQSALKQCSEAIQDGVWNEDWYRLKIDLDLTLGRYSSAAQTLALGLDKYSSSIHLRWQGYQVLRMNGRADEARQLLESIEATVRRYPWRFADSSNRLIIGRYMLETGRDPKTILTSFYDKAKELSPNSTAPYQAAAELALDKLDFALAAKELQRAIAIDEEDATLHYLLARAFASSDPERSEQALKRALELNPKHLDALLWTVDLAIDGERYEDARQNLAVAERINKRRPELWTYRAVLAHLDGDFTREAELVARALTPFPTNPEVEHLLGRKLSQKYRFAEGADYQRAALKKDSSYLPAKFQLSQDLLRLGEETEGWRLAEEVYKADNYHVVAHNLVTLHEVMDQFVTLKQSGIELRMGAREADLYGQRALRLLVRAKRELAPRYETEIDKPVIVEIFPEQKDFAIRTFGLPGGQGFLGVCFGRVITANSPASQGTHPSNWEATLWHEFCHVVTLEKTNNRMPRWLSEGISVYEERRAGPGWGQTMNSQYREMIVGGELVPVSQLSSAFLNPPSPLHLQFAYFESSLVVEYLVEAYGLDILQLILVDLGVGMPINESLMRYVGSLEKFDAEFESYARSEAAKLAAEADWSEANLAEDADAEAIEAYLQEHPANLAALRQRAMLAFAEEDWAAAVHWYEQLTELYAGVIDDANDYARLAIAYRRAGQLAAEKATLEHVVNHVADAGSAHERLLQLAVEREDWPIVRQQAERLLAINPIQSGPHLALANATERLSDLPLAIEAHHALLQFPATDLAATQYQLARLYLQSEQLPQARKHVLLAIQEAPRYREAYRLFQEIDALGSVAPPAADPLTGGSGE